MSALGSVSLEQSVVLLCGGRLWGVFRALGECDHSPVKGSKRCAVPTHPEPNRNSNLCVQYCFLDNFKGNCPQPHLWQTEQIIFLRTKLVPTSVLPNAPCCHPNQPTPPARVPGSDGRRRVWQHAAGMGTELVGTR